MVLKGGNFGSTHGTTGLGKLWRGLTLPLAMGALAGWCVTLAGIAVLRHQNGEAGLNFSWWVLFFELFVILMTLIWAAGLGRALGIGRGAVLAMLAVVTALKMQQTSLYNDDRHLFNGPHSGKLWRGVCTTFAGWLITSVFNGLLIIAVGAPQVYEHEHDNTHTTNAGYTGTTGTTGYQTTGTTAAARPVTGAGTTGTGASVV